MTMLMTAAMATTPHDGGNGNDDDGGGGDGDDGHGDGGDDMVMVRAVMMLVVAMTTRWFPR